MDQKIIIEKAKDIRDVIHYIKKFNNSSIVIYIDDKIINSPIFKFHIKDIKTIHDAGINISIIPGARQRINEILTNSNINWTFKNGNRIISEEHMPLLKMAAFDICNQVMTALAGEKLTAVIGNWVRARGKGVINGFDYETNGEIDKLDINTINNILSNRIIPIYPCIGWSITGKPYNISTIELAKQIAILTKADKLFYLIPGAKILSSNIDIPDNIPKSNENTVPALNIQELQSIINKNTNKHSDELGNNQLLTILNTAKEACNKGVSRIHILDGTEEGTLLCEIFSNLGSGTMIYSNSYGLIRPMEISDIPTVIEIMTPQIKSGVLLPRTENQLKENINNYYIYEIDESVKGCAALIQYPNKQFEIAALAINQQYKNMGIGPKIVSQLINIAKSRNAENVFVLTTQTSDWFENLGFIKDEIKNIPTERQKLWSPERNSKVYSLKL